MQIQVTLGVLVIFTGAVLGSVSEIPVCRFNHSVTCYGAVDHPLYLQLRSEHEIILRKDINEGYVTKKQILKFKNKNSSSIYNHSDYVTWTFEISNTTLIITSAKKKVSGDYSLETFHSNGTSTGMYHLQLIIEDVVSSVKVTDECLSSQRRVSCSSDGDQLHFSWTFNGLKDLDTHLTDGNRTVLLNKDDVGSITCSVRNHVSHGSKTAELHQCAGTSTMSTNTSPSSEIPSNGTSNANKNLTSISPRPSIAEIKIQHIALITMISFAVLLIVVSIIACYIYKKKQAPKVTGSSQEGAEVYVEVTHMPKAEKTGRTKQAEEENVEYAAVVIKPKKKKKEENKEEEVHYGELMFNTPHKQQKKQPEPQEECVYSHVQHKR